MSSVFNDSEGLYRTTVCRCLVRRPHYSVRLMRFGSRGPSEFFPQIRHRNAFTEIAWEDAVASEKNRELLHGIVVYRRRVLQRVTSLCVAVISRARPLENLKYQSPARSQIFPMEKISSPRERQRKWSLGLGDLGRHLKARRLA